MTPSAASSLKAEIGKHGPFESPAQEAYLNLVRTASILENAVERALRDHGLSSATYNALRILRGAGESGRVCHEIGEQLVARVPDVTRLIDRLERLGLVERRRTDADRRLVRVRITKAGLDLLAKLDEPMRREHIAQLAHMTASELDTLSILLAKARAPHLEPQPPSRG
jgi:DNA-binding MarR family transcriptional regulator